MDTQRVEYMRSLLIKAAVDMQKLEVPMWRFDGEELRNLNEVALTLGVPEIEAKEVLAREQVPGWGGSLGPFPHQYGQPHVYARDVQSGAGNCVCGRHDKSSIHVTTKDVHSGSGAGIISVGVGSKRKFAGICQRANALAYGNRRKRRKKTKEKLK
jgi:hypothetical protein